MRRRDTRGAGVDAVVTVPMGESRLSTSGAPLRTIGLGSCLAVVIFAPATRFAGLAHCMLPTADDAASRDAAPDAWSSPHHRARYVRTAIPDLVRQLQDAGAVAPFTATLVGGACLFPSLAAGAVGDIAGANVTMARTLLAEMAVPVRAEDVGGHVGRSLVADPCTQRVLVHTIRHGDRCL